MDLLTGKLYWPTTYEHVPAYPSLQEDIKCEVLIIGGGSSGAQCAYYLSEIGLDETTTDVNKRDTKIIHKRDKLIQEFQKLFPDRPVQPEFYIGAYYGGTHDGLPMIGMYDEMPNCYFVFAYGDNGIVYNMVLGKIIREMITKGTHPAAEIYLQTRPMLQK